MVLVCVACAHQHKGDLGDAGACLSCGSGDVVLVGDAHERELLTTRLMDRVKSLRRELAEEQAAHLDQTRDYAALRNGLRDVFGHGPDAPTPDKYLIARVKYLYPFAPPVGGGVAIPQGEDHVLAFDRATGWRKVPRGSVPPLPELPEEEPPSVTPTDVQGQGDDRPTYESYDVELCGHENLGRVRARRTPMGGLELEDGSLIGPAAIFRATRIQPPPPLPEPAPGLQVLVDGEKRTVIAVGPLPRSKYTGANEEEEEGVMLSEGRYLLRDEWARPRVELPAPPAQGRVPYQDDSIPF